MSALQQQCSVGRLHRYSNDRVHNFSDDNEISKTDSSSSAKGAQTVIEKVLLLMFADINIAQQFVSSCGNERIFVEVIFFFIF